MLEITNKTKKWSTLFGGVLIHLSLGSFYTFGNLSPYLTSYLREMSGSSCRYSNSNWIFSSLSISMAISSVLTGLFVSRFRPSLKLVIFIGCIVMSSGVALTYFTVKQSFFLTLLSYSIMQGIGLGISYLSPLEIAMKWFPDSKGSANSAILFGYGAGGIIFNQLQTRFINPNNVSPDSPFSDKFKDELYFSKQNNLDLLERVPKCFLLSAGVYLTFQLIGCCLIFEKKSNNDLSSIEEAHINKDENDLVRRLNETSSSDQSQDVNSLGVCYSDPNAGLSIKQVIKLPAFFVITLMLFNFGHASNLVIAYYKTFGQTFIKNDRFLSIVGSVSSFFNALGRLFWGFLVDKLPYKICYLILCSISIALVSTIYLTKYMAFKEFYLIWVCAVYFTQCGIFVITPTAVAKCFGQKNFSSIYGSMFLLNLPASFISTLLGETIVTLGWFWFFMIGACLSILGWITALFFRVKKSDGTDI